MKTLLAVLFLMSGSAEAGRSVRVRAHVTKSGQYVRAHVRSAPDGRKSNNYSTEGNVNPSTGKEGTK